MGFPFYNSEIWILHIECKRRLFALEMDYLTRNEMISRLEIRRRMKAEETVIYRKKIIKMVRTQVKNG